MKTHSTFALATAFILISILYTAAIPVSSSSSPTVYLIRHGEKPDDKTITGLSQQGIQRSQCLKKVFGQGSIYNIGYIITEQVMAFGERNRPYLTVEPLANSLNLQIDQSCDRDNADCVAQKIKSYKGIGNILVCWQHDHLTQIVHAMGNPQSPEYPEEYGVIWTSAFPYETISTSNENCPGLGQ